MKKTLSVIVCIVMLLSMTAVCHAQQGQAAVRGFGGEVSVSLEVDESGKVIQAAAVGESETAGIGSNAIEQMPKAMVEAGTIDVEGISGATVTSQAVLDAAKAAYALATGTQTQAGGMTPGVYTSTVNSYYSTVTVQVELSETRIESVEVTDCVAIRAGYNTLNEATFAPAKKNIPERIVQHQTLNIDAVTGATVSSNAILSAVADCVKQAGGKTSDFSKPVEKLTGTEEYTCDVLVIGGGTAGSMAASHANENGAKVIVFEKSGKVGGTGAVSAGPFAPGAHFEGQAAATDPALRFKVWNELADFSTNGGILANLIWGSAEVIHYMHDKGFEFEGPKNFNNCWHSYNYELYDMYDFAGRKQYNTDWFTSMVYEIEENSGMVMLETTGDHLLYDENGKVAGAVGYRADGTTVIVNADAVVLSTGGYIGNEEMVKEKYGYTFKTIAYLQNDGAGIRMGLDAGGMLYHDMLAPLAHMQGTYVELDPFTFDNNVDNYLLHTLTYTPGLMQVNASGTRYHNEGTLEASCLVEACNAHAAQGEYFYTLLSQNQIEILKTAGIRGLGSEKKPFGASYVGVCAEPDDLMPNIEAVLEKGMEIETVFKGETLEELAAAAGMTADILVRNVAQYNEFCAQGADKRFDKDPKFLHAYSEGPFYAVKCAVYAYNTLGGLNVDENINVLRADMTPIEGLYCAGADSIGVIMNKTAYPDLGGPALTWGLYSGYTAGANAAAYAGSK